MSTIYDGIFFDLDGTLLDNNEFILAFYRHTFNTHLNRDIDMEYISQFFGKPFNAPFAEYDEKLQQELAATARSYAQEHQHELVRLFPETVEMLESISKSGIKLAIITSKPVKIALMELKLFKIDQYFSIITGGDSCDKPKPDPAPVCFTLSALNLSPHKCLFIGDSPADIISGQQAGVKTAAVRWTKVGWAEISSAHPDFVIDSMKHIMSISELK